VIGLCFLMGVYPAPILRRIQPSIDRIIARVERPARVASR
jgi:NADH:ubiquinone oxidoreductase subunit 4 (subunit M)